MWKTAQKLKNINGIVNRRNFIPLNQYKARNITTLLNRKQLKLFGDEYKAIVSLLSRSLGISPQTIRQIHLRHCTNSNKNNDEAKKLSGQQPQQQKPNTPDNKEQSTGSGGDGGGPNDDKDKMQSSFMTKIVMWVFTTYMFVTLMTLLTAPKNERPKESDNYVSWNEFVHHMLAVGEVKEIIIHTDIELVTIVLHEGAIIKGKKPLTRLFYMPVADASKFEERLRDVEKQLGITNGVPVSYKRNSYLVNMIIPLIFFGIIVATLLRMKGLKNPLSMDVFSQMGRAKFTLVDPYEGGRGVLFKDVAGLEEAKLEIKEFVEYLKEPEKYQRLGAKVPKGALLLGPPGCGKTLLAKAVATEAQVPFLSMNGSEFIEMIGGLGAARVRDLFKEGEKRAPCIIYIDEIDAIGRKRSGTESFQQGASGESEQTLNQLLVEMDGMVSKEGVLMLASTNRADVLDKALLRPGRFDRHILIDLPTLQERKEIFEKHLSSIKLEAEPHTYSQRLARLTPGFSGADIANVCNEAALHAARNSKKLVGTEDLEYAVERLVGGTEKRSHALSLVERRTIAYHESGHALVGWLLPNSDVLLKVTIVPRTSLALGFAQYTPSDQHLYSKEQLFDKMCMALGGRAAENLIFKSITTGAQNDLEKVTKIAYSQIKKFGMNEKLGPIYIRDAEETEGYDKPFSKALDTIIDHEARNLIASAYQKTEEILKTNHDKLVKLAETLLEKETLNYDEIVKLIGPPAYDTAKRLIEPVEFEQSLKNLSEQEAK